MTEFTLLLGNIVLHLTLLLGLVWLLDHAGVLAGRRHRELAWRGALLAGLVIAPAQWFGSAVNVIEPWRAHITLPEPSAALSATANAATVKPQTATPSHGQTSPAPAANAARLDEAFAWPDFDVRTLLLAAWLAIAAALLAHLLFGWIGMARSLKERAPVRHAALAAMLRELSVSNGRQAPQLTVSNRIAGPVCLGNEICLPAWALERLTARQQRAMLAHELAHSLRRDPLWQAAVSIIACMFFFHPLVHVARRRLERLAELACDDWAAVATGEDRALAECLAECAAVLVERRHWARVAAPGMARQNSDIVHRVRRLLAGDVEQPGEIDMKTRLLFAALLSGSILALPVIGAAVHAGNEHTISNEVTRMNDTTKMRTRIGDLDVSLEAEGKFTFNDAENDLARMDKGGELDIEIDDGDGEHEFRFRRPRSDIERRYFVDGEERPFDARAREKLASVLPMVLRESGLDAKNRVARFLQRGGADAVLEEIDLIHSDYSARLYLVELVAQTDLNEAQFSRAAQRSARLHSDYERRVALLGIAENANGSQSRTAALLDAMQGMDSDYEQRVVLVGLAQRLPVHEQHDKLLTIMRGIDSDYELRVVMTQFGDHLKSDPKALRRIIALVDEIVESDYETRATLTHLAKSLVSAADMKAYLGAAANIGSDYEKRVALTALAEADTLDTEALMAYMNAALTIGSDYEARVALTAVAEQVRDDASLRDRYLGVAARLSEHEAGAALRAMDMRKTATR